MTELKPALGDCVVLEPTLDLNAAEPLRAALMERRGLPLRIDASQVQRLGGLCLQVLLAAQNAWRLDGTPLHIEAHSHEFSETLKLFGAAALLQPCDGVNS